MLILHKGDVYVGFKDPMSAGLWLDVNQEAKDTILPPLYVKEGRLN